jgi:hypothetical protein
MLSIATGIPPSTLWRERPEDLATLMDVLGDQGRRRARKR